MMEFISVLENKNTDTNANRSKTIAWQTVAKRTMKLDAKKNMSHVRRSMTCSGGGPKPSSPEPETIEILNMIPQEFETDTNVFDSDSIVSQEVESLVDVETQEFVLTPIDKKENVKENITPQPAKNTEPFKLFKQSGTKRKLPLNEVKDNKRTSNREERDFARERHMVLINSIRAEHELKIKNMIEAQGFLKEEHDLKMKHMLLQNEETRLQIEKLNMEIIIKKKKLT